MKKQFLKVALLGLATTLTVTSCSKSDDNTDAGVQNFDNSNFKGTLVAGKTATLDASKTYKLTGPVIVEDGAKLVIPAGTRIESNAGTSGYVVVKQGGKIFCNGTSSNPVVFTSASANPAPQDWGGIVICGKAKNNKGSNIISEVGNASYGGDNDADNSGVIQYTRVEYSGANFNPEKEFNGISFFAVGSQTVVDHVQIYKGNDDGVEFFGGAVKANYLVVTEAGDDSFDWTEGWRGGGSHWYSTKGTEGDRGIEADNLKADNLASPTSNPTISNVTLVGNGNSDGMKLRRGTKGAISNVVLSNWSEGFDVDDAATITNVSNGSLKVTNVQFDNVTTKNDSDAAGVYTEANNSGAGNGTSKPSWANGWTK